MQSRPENIHFFFAHQVVGYFEEQTAFICQIIYPGAIQTLPYGINNAALVVGTWSNQTTVKGFWVQMK